MKTWYHLPPTFQAWQAESVLEIDIINLHWLARLSSQFWEDAIFL